MRDSNCNHCNKIYIFCQNYINLNAYMLFLKGPKYFEYLGIVCHSTRTH